MEDQKIYEFHPEKSNINTDTFFKINQERDVTNQAKQLIKTFENKYSGSNNQRRATTEINQISQNNPSYQILSVKNKGRDDLNSYDVYSQRDYIIPSKKKSSSSSAQQAYNLMLKENQRLKKRVMELIIENQNLRNILNSNNFPSPINSFNRQSQMFGPDSENNINIYNNNNLMNIPFNDKRFFEESIESAIKANMKLPHNNINKINNNLIDLKKEYNTNTNNSKMGYLRKNKKYNNNKINNKENNIDYSASNLNNNANDEYSQLINEYKNKKMKLEQQDLINEKDISNKYHTLKNNYNELQNKNIDLMITIQKMRNDNEVLTRQLEELSRQKKNLDINKYKIKNKVKSDNNINNEGGSNNLNELKALKSKYSELEKYVEDIMKEKREVNKEDKMRKSNISEILAQNKELKNIINDLKKNEREKKNRFE